MKKIFLLILVLSFNYIFAQENNISPFFSAGRASDNDAIRSFGGDGAGLRCWETGPIFRLDDRFSVLVQGDLFFREYLGSAWLLGFKYSPEQIL